MGKQSQRMISVKNAGLKAFKRGEPSWFNPYFKNKGRNKELHQEWKRGWQDGLRMEKKRVFHEMSLIEKFKHMTRNIK